ncbi:hypothetical protein [Aegicerativicinus sediminis]|uniref:hypothetical protein n=1 Tax=Aegicerativicinus sediminis TaxID=2893202 RepID=UPI001E659C1E|nr:hypothetical protein [Aegicerativicinus sediminis]
MLKSNLLIVEFSQFIEFLDVIVWPLTLIAVVWLFRKNLSGIISNIGSVKAGASGFEMTFQEKLANVSNLLENDTHGKTKSASDINVGFERPGNPYQQLLNLRDKLHSKILRKAIDSDIPINDNSTRDLINHLKLHNYISSTTAQNVIAFMELTEVHDPNITQTDVNKATTLFKLLNI